VAGILVAKTSGMTRVPSEHYAAALSSASPSFRRLVGDLIDGRVVEPDGSSHEIMPIEEGSTYCRIVCVDLTPGVDTCFLINVWSRNDNGRNGQWDDRGTPQLLDDVRIDGEWQLYNCIIALRSRSLSSVFPEGEFPRD
jgi:hypothetical protein